MRYKQITLKSLKLKKILQWSLWFSQGENINLNILEVVDKLRHAEKWFITPPPLPCHKFSKQQKICIWTVKKFFNTSIKRDVICERALIQAHHDQKFYCSEFQNVIRFKNCSAIWHFDLSVPRNLNLYFPIWN